MWHCFLYLYFCQVCVDEVTDARGVKFSSVLHDDLLQEISYRGKLVDGLLHSVDRRKVFSQRGKNPGQVRLRRHGGHDVADHDQDLLQFRIRVLEPVPGNDSPENVQYWYVEQVLK